LKLDENKINKNSTNKIEKLESLRNIFKNLKIPIKHEGFESKKLANKVCKLQKFIYELKQALRS